MKGSKQSARFMARLNKYCDEHKLNWHKVLCLKWQHETGKKCTNKNHTKGIYKNKLECEAALTEGLSMSFQYAGISKKNENKIFEKFPK